MTGHYIFWMGVVYGVTCGLCLSAFLSYVLRRLRDEQESGPADYMWAVLLGVMAIMTSLFV